MESNNPVIKKMRNSFYKENGFDYNNNLNNSGLSSLNGVFGKIALSFGMVFIFSLISFLTVPIVKGIFIPLIVASLAVIVVAAVVSSRVVVKWWHVLIYAVIEGFFLGVFTKILELAYPGIALMAVLATFVVAALTLITYLVSGKRVGNRFRRIIGIGTLSLCIIYIINLIFILFHINLGITNFGSHAGILSYVISAIAVILAVLNLVIDFDSIRSFVEAGSPKNEEWRMAFGLTVTMVWLYVEILRVLSYFRN